LIKQYIQHFSLFGGIGVKMIFYHLNHSLRLFCFSYFSNRVFSFCSGWPETVILLIFTSQIARFTNVHHHTCPLYTTVLKEASALTIEKCVKLIFLWIILLWRMVTDNAHINSITVRSWQSRSRLSCEAEINRSY
jgi:hypothetical protein